MNLHLLRRVGIVLVLNAILLQFLNCSKSKLTEEGARLCYIETKGYADEILFGNLSSLEKAKRQFL
ncbi:MAG: hypothetical protein H7A24_09935 [Leptospiraceae bacterium]|nr:hypothetical protein [Leptospiraceae bacterium]MCP5512189.1 hypothetical protein [Leptospiraceae bacterium]